MLSTEQILYGLLGMGRTGWPPQLAHSSWALKQLHAFGARCMYLNPAKWPTPMTAAPPGRWDQNRSSSSKRQLDDQYHRALYTKRFVWGLNNPPKGIKVLQLPPTLLTHTQRCRRTEVVTVMSPGTGQNPFHRSPTERAVRGTEACSEQWSLTTTIFFFCFVSMVSIVLALGTTEQHYGVNCATLPKRSQYSIDWKNNYTII